MSLENIFKRSLEEGKHGDFTDYRKWLNENGFDLKKGMPFESNIDVFKMDKIVNWTKEIEEIAKLIGFFSSQKNISAHINISLPTGFGKSMFLNIIKNLLEETTKQKVELMDAAEFRKITDEEIPFFYGWLDAMKDNKIKYIMIDDCEKDYYNMKYNLETIFSNLENIFLVTSWSNSSWHLFRLNNNHLVNDTLKTFYFKFKDLTKEENIKLLRNRILYFKKDDSIKPFTDDAIDLIAKFSNPGYSIYLSSRLLDHLYRTGEKEINRAFVAEYSKNCHIDSTIEYLLNIDDLQLRILLEIMESGLNNNPGVNIESIAEKSGRDRTTISYHLRKLKSTGLIGDKAHGREVLYTINNEIVPLIETVLKGRFEW